MLAPLTETSRRERAEGPKSKSTTEIETLFELGQGGMATAYLARTLGTGGFERLVVLKRLNGELAKHRDAVQRFLAEARVAARLHHVNVVGTHQIGWDALGPFIVLDYVEGGSLADLLDAAGARDERLPVGVVLRIALDVLAGLRAVHEATDGEGQPLGILHRDVSLENVLVGVSDGVARLSDFGVAKSALGPSLTEPGCFVGKVLYFAPEYLLREPVGETLDLYALGVTLWLALTGDDLWPNMTDGKLARAIVEEGVPSLDGRRDVSPEVRDFVARACAREPSARFPSAREMAAALQKLERRPGLVAAHVDVAAAVERLLGARLRTRRETVARLAPELLGGPPSGPLELRETVRDSRNFAPESEPARPKLPRVTHVTGIRRARTLAVPAAALLVVGVALSLLLRPPERPPGAPRVVATEAVAPVAPHLSEASVLPLAAPSHAAPVETATSPLRAPARVTSRRAPAPKRAPPPASAEVEPARAPSDIARKNPYR
jgi:serine/threonine-protein kinase